MNSPSQHEAVIVYLDFNFGTKVVPEVLRASGIPFELHSSHLPPDAPDEAWIRLCSDMNWIALSKDNRLQTNPAARRAISESEVAVFSLVSKNRKGAENGRIIAESYERLLGYTRSHARPFLANLYSTGKISKVNLKR